MKARSSKLDQYAPALADMDAEKKTLEQMREWLKGEGCTVSSSTLSEFLSAQRSARQQAAMLSQIASGARQAKEVEKQFANNPAPELDTLIRLHRVMILQLSTQAQADTEMLKLADQLTRTAMEYVSGKTKANHKERELKLAEEKFQLDFCEKILDRALREQAERIAGSNMSQADKIAAMRKAAFKDVEELEKSGKLEIPK